MPYNLSIIGSPGLDLRPQVLYYALFYALHRRMRQVMLIFLGFQPLTTLLFIVEPLFFLLGSNHLWCHHARVAPVTGVGPCRVSVDEDGIAVGEEVALGGW